MNERAAKPLQPCWQPCFKGSAPFPPPTPTPTTFHPEKEQHTNTSLGSEQENHIHEDAHGKMVELAASTASSCESNGQSTPPQPPLPAGLPEPPAARPTRPSHYYHQHWDLHATSGLQNCPADQVVCDFVIPGQDCQPRPGMSSVPARRALPSMLQRVGLPWPLAIRPAC